MRQFSKMALATLVIVSAAEIAQAQIRQRRPYRPPTVSPYVNLLRRNEDRRITYLGIIRPQIENQRFQYEQRQRIANINSRFSAQQRLERDRFLQTQQSIEQLRSASGLKSVETGIRPVFMQRSKYFPRLR